MSATIKIEALPLYGDGKTWVNVTNLDAGSYIISGQIILSESSK